MIKHGKFSSELPGNLCGSAQDKITIMWKRIQEVFAFQRDFSFLLSGGLRDAGKSGTMKKSLLFVGRGTERKEHDQNTK